MKHLDVMLLVFALCLHRAVAGCGGYWSSGWTKCSTLGSTSECQSNPAWPVCQSCSEGFYCGTCDRSNSCARGNECKYDGTCAGPPPPTPSSAPTSGSSGGSTNSGSIGAVVACGMGVIAYLWCRKGITEEQKKNGLKATVVLTGLVAIALSGKSGGSIGGMIAVWIIGFSVFIYAYEKPDLKYRNWIMAGSVIISLIVICSLGSSNSSSGTGGVGVGSIGNVGGGSGGGGSGGGSSPVTKSSLPTPAPSPLPEMPTALPTVQATLNCPAGYYSNSSSYTSCAACPVGSTSPGGWSGTCHYCNPGTTGTNAGQGSCTPCPIGKYSRGVGFNVPVPLVSSPAPPEVLQCTTCPGSIITPVPGAIDVSQCIDPTPNFVVGSVGLVLALGLTLVYFCYGRFHTIAKIRYDRIITHQMVDCQWIVKEVDEINATHKEENKFRKFKVVVSSVLRTGESAGMAKIWLFFKALAVISVGCILVILSTIGYFVGLVAGIFFKALIIWKHLRLIHLFQLHLPYPDVVAFAVAEILRVLHTMNFPFIDLVEGLLTPFRLLFQLLSRINISFDLVVSISCKGATAPLELLMDMLVLGIIIIVIESKVQLYREISFKQTSHKFFASIASIDYLKSLFFKGGVFSIISHVFLLLQCLLAEFLAGLLNFQSALQFSMSYVNLQSFVANNGVHEFSDICNQVAAAPNIDSFLAWSSTLVALFSIPPALYEISKILCPLHPKSSYDKDIRDAMDEHQIPSGGLLQLVTKNSLPLRWLLTLISPDIMLSRLTSSWIDTMRIAIAGRVAVHRQKLEQILKVLGDANISSAEISIVARRGEEALAPVDGKDPPAERFHDFFRSLVNKNAPYREALHTVSPTHESILSLEAWGWIIYHVSEKQTEEEVAGKSFGGRRSSIKAGIEDFEHGQQLPTYYRLLQAESLELTGQTMFAPLFGIILFGHLFSAVGRKAFYRVFQRYSIFFGAALGHWSAVSGECYITERDRKSFLPAMEKSSSGLSSREIRYSNKNLDEGDNSANKETRETMTQFLKAVIAPRAILLQLVPHLTIMSVFSAATAGSPLLVFDEEIKNNLHSIISASSTSNVQWIKILETIISLVTESRLVNFFIQTLCCAVSVYILYFPVGNMVLAAIALLVPYCVCKSLNVLVYLGTVAEVDTMDLCGARPAPLIQEAVAHAVPEMAACLRDLGKLSASSPAEETAELEKILSDPNVELRAWHDKILQQYSQGPGTEEALNRLESAINVLIAARKGEAIKTDGSRQSSRDSYSKRASSNHAQAQNYRPSFAADSYRYSNESQYRHSIEMQNWTSGRNSLRRGSTGEGEVINNSRLSHQRRSLPATSSFTSYSPSSSDNPGAVSADFDDERRDSIPSMPYPHLLRRDSIPTSSSSGLDYGYEGDDSYAQTEAPPVPPPAAFSTQPLKRLPQPLPQTTRALNDYRPQSSRFSAASPRPVSAHYSPQAASTNAASVAYYDQSRGSEIVTQVSRTSQRFSPQSRGNPQGRQSQSQDLAYTQSAHPRDSLRDYSQHRDTELHDNQGRFHGSPQQAMYDDEEMRHPRRDSWSLRMSTEGHRQTFSSMRSQAHSSRGSKRGGRSSSDRPYSTERMTF